MNFDCNFSYFFVKCAVKKIILTIINKCVYNENVLFFYVIFFMSFLKADSDILKTLILNFMGGTIFQFPNRKQPTSFFFLF